MERRLDAMTTLHLLAMTPSLWFEPPRHDRLTVVEVQNCLGMVAVWNEVGGCLGIVALARPYNCSNWPYMIATERQLPYRHCRVVCMNVPRVARLRLLNTFVDRDVRFYLSTKGV